MLSDVFPTGWHGVELAKMQPGETVVYGAGPVGLMAAAYSAQIKGATQVFVVDQQPTGSSSQADRRRPRRPQDQ